MHKQLAIIFMMVGFIGLLSPATLAQEQKYEENIKHELEAEKRVKKELKESEKTRIKDEREARKEAIKRQREAEKKGFV